MNRHRWSNIQRARSCYEAGSPQTARGPIEAFFEIAARCNLRCRMCAINEDARYRNSSGRPALFTPEMFARVATAFPTLVRAYLFGLGEPLLNPHLPEYVERLSRCGVEVWFNTNGTLIDERMAERLAMAGADRITVSIDGATKETYEAIRRGAKFADVTRGIAALTAAGRRYGRPKVNLSFVAMRSNIGELPALVELAARLGTTGVHVEPLYAQEEATLEEHYARENLGTVPAGRVREIMDDASVRARALGLDLASRFLAGAGSFDYVERAPSLAIDWACTEPWSSIWVTSAGEVRTCCINETSFGTLSEAAFDEIWDGPSFRAFRLQHVARAEPPAGCANCIRNGRPRHSPFFRTLERVTYRPLRLPGSASAPPVRIDRPARGETVTDPLVVTGIATAAARAWDVMIDDCAIPSLDLMEDGRFVASGEVPFLTEGAHVVWIRGRNGEAAEGWDHREIHFWRPAAQEGAIARTTGLASRRLPYACPEPRVFIDRRLWPAARLVERHAAPPLLLIDTAALTPAEHQIEVWSGRSKIDAFCIERLNA